MSYKNNITIKDVLTLLEKTYDNFTIVQRSDAGEELILGPVSYKTLKYKNIKDLLDIEVEYIECDSNYKSCIKIVFFDDYNDYSYIKEGMKYE